MNQTNLLKHRLIDKILSTKNKKTLQKLDELLESEADEIVELSQDQKKLIQMGLDDIAQNHTISQEEADKTDLTWLAGK